MVKLNSLTAKEKSVIIDKATEAPFSGKYNKFYEKGVYLCKQCGNELYLSSAKFNSHCGWPSFDDEIKGAVKRITDADGRRTEIVCAKCNGHLGHVFLNEGFTSKNTRHCVNSISMVFKPQKDIKKQNNVEKALFAEGCFWGTEYWMEKQKGVTSAVSGYTGGKLKNPTYYQVSSGTSGHIETVEVTFNPQIISYQELVKLFFNTHDATQTNGQGPDIGSQYHSAIFYTSEKQKKIAEDYKKKLMAKGYKIVTKIIKATKFYPAEKYHQDYYRRKGSKPYCHVYKNKF